MDAIILIGLFSFVSLWTLLSIYILRGMLFETPFYPSRVSHIEKAFNALRISFGPQTKFVDLGSGDGRVVVWAAKKGMQSTGIEINPFLSLISRLKIKFFGLTENAKIENLDFFKIDFSDYDIVYMYIYKEVMNKLKDKLFSEMKPGSIIVSNVFTFDGVEPDEVNGRFKVYKIKNN